MFKISELISGSDINDIKIFSGFLSMNLLNSITDLVKIGNNQTGEIIKFIESGYFFLILFFIAENISFSNMPIFQVGGNPLLKIYVVKM